MNFSFSSSPPYDATLSIPSYRQVVDLDDLTRSVMILPCGQSGFIGNRHYDDCLEEYVRGKYRSMLWNRPDVENYQEGKIVLKQK